MARYRIDIIDRRKANAVVRKLKTWGDRVKKHAIDIINEYRKRYLEDGELTLRHIVDQFYEDYTPAYNRKLDLYNAYKVTIENGEWTYYLGGDLMHFQHGSKNNPVSNDYIFENSFVNGYHGGATGGKFHPNPGEPWWKVPKEFKYWLAPATQFGGSPYFMAQDDMSKLMDDLRQEKLNKIDKILTKEYDEIYDAILNMFKI